MVAPGILQQINSCIDFQVRRKIILQRGFKIKPRAGVAVSKIVEIFVVFEKRTALNSEIQRFAGAIVKRGVRLKQRRLCLDFSHKEKRQQEQKAAKQVSNISGVICGKTFNNR